MWICDRCRAPATYWAQHAATMEYKFCCDAHSIYNSFCDWRLIDAPRGMLHKTLLEARECERRAAKTITAVGLTYWMNRRDAALHVAQAALGETPLEI